MVLLKKISVKAKKIEVVKDLAKPKSVHNIQVFLGFASFYERFIQGFNRIAALLISMLKTTKSLDEPAPSRNDGSKSASSRNNISRLAFGRNDGNDENNRYGVGKNSVEQAKKSGKLFKSGKSKSEKTSKS